MSVQAYSAASNRVENARSVEYRLFGQVTRALMDASATDQADFATRIDAIDWNRRLWSTLASACSAEDNGMDRATRAQIVSLSIFVNKHSSQVMRGKEDFETLIDINKAIMQGLAGVQAA